jgi:hypothetical protein
MMSSTLIVCRPEHLVGELRAVGGSGRVVRDHRPWTTRARAARGEREPRDRSGQRRDDRDQNESHCGEREQVRAP